MDFGDRLKQTRKDKGMTQGELSEVAGVSRESIINYETRKRSPPSDILAKLATALGADANYLLHGQTREEREASFKAQADKRFEDARAWLEAREVYLQGIPDEDKKAFDTLAKTIRESKKEEQHAAHKENPEPSR